MNIREEFRYLEGLKEVPTTTMAKAIIRNMLKSLEYLKNLEDHNMLMDSEIVELGLTHHKYTKAKEWLKNELNK